MTTEWKLLPVPAEDYEELKHMVGFRQEQRGEAAAPSLDKLRSKQLKRDATIRAAFDEHQPWPEVSLRRLAAATTATTERFSQVMDICMQLRAENADEPIISTTEIADRTGMSVEQWRAACRNINDHMKKHYPEVPLWPEDSSWAGRPFWPLVNMAGRSLSAKKDELYVGITEEQAKRWRKVRTGQ